MAHVWEKKKRSEDVQIHEDADFSTLLLSDRVLSGLTKAGFRKPSPIQLEAIPVGRFGKDLLVQAKSGTGKTLVFVIVALEMLKRKLSRPQVMILVPTREIATQICSVIKAVGSSFHNLTYGSFIGGLSLSDDKEKAHCSQIIVGTPGRIKQLILLKSLPTNSVRLMVFDEADQLLTFGMKEDIDDIFNSLPSDKQVIATSATYPPKLKKMIFRYLREPHVAYLKARDLALLGIIHYAVVVDSTPMPVIRYKFRLQALEPILKNIKFTQCLVYCNGINKVETLCKDIKKWGFSTTYISSAKDQSDRLKAMERLKRFKCKVLVSSDVTARGIDAENVDLVVNFDLAHCFETYLHRAGRAGRYGSVGVTVAIIDDVELTCLNATEKCAGFKTYKLPDPIPFDLIENPYLQEYVIKDPELPYEEFLASEADQEESVTYETKPSKIDSKIKVNGKVQNENSVTANDDTEHEETQSKHLLSLSSEMGIDTSEKQNGIQVEVPEITEVGSKSVTVDDIENIDMNLKASYLENGESGRSTNFELEKVSEGVTELLETKSECVSQIEILNCLNANHVADLILDVPSDSNNSEVSNFTCATKNYILNVANESKNTDAASCTFINKDTKEKSSDLSAKDLPQSFENQNVEMCSKDVDLSGDYVNDVDLNDRLAGNEINDAVACFVHNYETHKKIELHTENGVGDTKSSLTENCGKKKISTSVIKDLNSEKFDYFYGVFKNFQGDNDSSEAREDKVKENLNETEVISPQNEICYEEKIYSDDVTSEYNAIQNVHSEINDSFDLANEKQNIDVMNCIENLKLESTEEFDHVSFFSDNSVHKSISDVIDKSKYKVTVLFDITDETSEKSDSVTESDYTSKSDFTDKCKYETSPSFDTTKYEATQTGLKPFFNENFKESYLEIESGCGSKSDIDKSNCIITPLFNESKCSQNTLKPFFDEISETESDEKVDFNVSHSSSLKCSESETSSYSSDSSSSCSEDDLSESSEQSISSIRSRHRNHYSLTDTSSSASLMHCDRPRSFEPSCAKIGPRATQNPKSVSSMRYGKKKSSHRNHDSLSESSSSESLMHYGRNKSRIRNKSPDRNHDSSSDTSSSESLMHYRKNKSRNVKENNYPEVPHHSRHLKCYYQSHSCCSKTTQRNSYCLNAYPHHSSYLNAYSHHPNCLNTYPCHSSCLCTCPRHSSCSENERHVPRIGHNSGNRNTFTSQYQPQPSVCSGHVAACFMPSVHRCHSYGLRDATCNQDKNCDKWFNTFYMQRMQIQQMATGF